MKIRIWDAKVPVMTRIMVDLDSRESALKANEFISEFVSEKQMSKETASFWEKTVKNSRKKYELPKSNKTTQNRIVFAKVS